MGWKSVLQVLLRLDRLQTQQAGKQARKHQRRGPGAPPWRLHRRGDLQVAERHRQAAQQRQARLAAQLAKQQERELKRRGPARSGLACAALHLLWSGPLKATKPSCLLTQRHCCPAPAAGHCRLHSII